MTTKVYEDGKAIVTALEQGLPGVTVLPGWMAIYESDLIQGRNGRGFPCVCVFYDKDQNTRLAGTPDNKISRTLTMAGAVRVVDGQDINETLDNLLFDVKKALVDVSKLTLPDVSFMLPETSTEYAMFVAKVVFTTTEKWQ